MANRCCNLGLFFMLFGFVMGCGAKESVPVDPGPSYADLVVTYNAELETLDRLEAKREKLIATYAAASLTDSDEPVTTLSQLEDLLESAKGLKEGSGSDFPTDPDELLDSLSERGGEATEIAEQLLGDILGGGGDAAPAVQPERESTPEEKAAAAERKAAFDTELASLDQELSKQRERVNRAKDARDAAESK